MGNAVTKNIINQHMSASVKVLNDTVQNCGTQMTQEQLLDVAGSGNTVRHVDFSSMMSADISCSQTASVQNDISQKLSSKMEQMAKSIMGAISLNPGNAEATNISKASLALGTTIRNSFNQNCGSSLNSNQTLKVGGNNNTIEFISYKQAASIVKNCVQNSSAVTSAKQDLEAAIKQVATAEKKGLSLMMLVVIILGIIGALYFGGVKLATNPFFWIGCITLIAGYVGLAWFLKWWPFLSAKNAGKGDTYYRGRADYAYPTNQEAYTEESGQFDPDDDDYVGYS